jgi:hypothetical protein
LQAVVAKGVKPIDSGEQKGAKLSPAEAKKLMEVAAASQQSAASAPASVDSDVFDDLE